MADGGVIMSRFLKANIGWSRGASFFPSKIIRHFEKSFFNHVFYSFELCNGMKLLYESHMRGGVQITPFEHIESAAKSGKVEALYEYDLELLPPQIEVLWHNCTQLHGRGYDAGQIIRYYLSYRLRRDFSRKYDDGNYTCNELVVSAGHDVIPKMYCTNFSFTPEKLFKLFHSGTGSNQLFG
jgi:hypothetical protein